MASGGFPSLAYNRIIHEQKTPITTPIGSISEYMRNYPGHKKRDGVYHKIINEIPSCDIYRELFAGSAAIASLLKIPEAQIHLNEKDVKVFQDLRFAFPSNIVTNDCAISVIKNLPSKPQRKEVVFLDPPYRHKTRPQNTLIYDCEMSDDDHEQLLMAVLEKSPAYNFIIQHPEDEMYNDFLKGWRKTPIKMRYHRKTQIEILYTNYEKPTALQDYSCLGDNRHDRQRIKRKGDRLVAKMLELPAVERNYVINRLNEINKTD